MICITKRESERLREKYPVVDIYDLSDNHFLGVGGIILQVQYVSEEKENSSDTLNINT